MVCRVTRIHLKTSGENREKLIDYCLNGDVQYVAIGWSGAFEANPNIKTYSEYYSAVKKNIRKWRIKNRGDMIIPTMSFGTQKKATCFGQGT